MFNPCTYVLMDKVASNQSFIVEGMGMKAFYKELIKGIVIDGNCKFISRKGNT